MAMKQKVLTGAAIALAASGLVFSAAVLADDKHEEAKIHCAGINSCKGKTACKSATNDCKGQNSCKGKGWEPAASEQECTDKGGKTS